MSNEDPTYVSNNVVALVGRVDKRWDSSGRGPLVLLVETYKRLRDGRAIKRRDRCVIWPDFMKEQCRGLGEGDQVSIVGSLDSEKNAQGEWRDIVRVQMVQGGDTASSQPARPPSGYGAPPAVDVPMPDDVDELPF